MSSLIGPPLCFKASTSLHSMYVACLQHEQRAAVKHKPRVPCQVSGCKIAVYSEFQSQKGSGATRPQRLQNTVDCNRSRSPAYDFEAKPWEVSSEKVHPLFLPPAMIPLIPNSPGDKIPRLKTNGWWTVRSGPASSSSRWTSLLCSYQLVLEQFVADSNLVS